MNRRMPYHRQGLLLWGGLTASGLIEERVRGVGNRPFLFESVRKEDTGLGDKHRSCLWQYEQPYCFEGRNNIKMRPHQT